MSDKQAGGEDFRDVRTQQGPPGAANRGDRSSNFYVSERADDGSSLDDGIDRLVDPSLRDERISNNFDVLDLDRDFIVESEELGFAGDPGTTDVIEAVEGEEVYFPPTDPPVGMRGNTIEVLDGFSDTSLDELDPEDHPLQLQGNDDDLAEQVRYALATDSYTADLNIEVEVEYGVVYLHGKVRSLEDIEQAEQVAGNVPGIEDVEEDLEIV